MTGVTMTEVVIAPTGRESNTCFRPAELPLAAARPELAREAAAVRALLGRCRQTGRRFQLLHPRWRLFVRELVVVLEFLLEAVWSGLELFQRVRVPGG